MGSTMADPKNASSEMCSIIVGLRRRPTYCENPHSPSSVGFIPRQRRKARIGIGASGRPGPAQKGRGTQEDPRGQPYGRKLEAT